MKVTPAILARKPSPMQEDAARKARKKRNGMKSNKLKRTRTFMVTVKDEVVTVMERTPTYDIVGAWAIVEPSPWLSTPREHSQTTLN